MAAKLRVGLVGNGGHGMVHVRTLAKLKDEAEIVALCDIKPGLAEKWTQEFGGKPFTSAEEMMDSVELDALFITIPPTCHGLELLAIERGIPFQVEKPVNLDVAQAEAIAKAAEEKGVLAAAGYMNRYRRGINEAARIFQEDPPVLTIGGWIGGPPPYVEDGIMAWWVKRSMSGGQFVEQVTHTIDLVRLLCGEPVSVTAQAATGFIKDHPTYDLDDALAVTIQFESGGVANLYSCCASKALGGVDLNVYATSAAVRFTGWEHTAAIHCVGKDPVEIKGEEDIFIIEDRTFLGAVRTGDPSGVLSTYKDAVKTLKLSLAANEAAQTGRTVTLS